VVKYIIILDIKGRWEERTSGDDEEEKI